MRVTARSTIAVLGLLALCGCAATAPTATVVPAAVVSDSAVEVIESIPYTTSTEPMLLDACLPPGDAAEARAAVVVIHGGSWARGDKSDPPVRDTCQRLADHGFVAFAINYRLAPASTFPAQLNDVQAAVRWLRLPSQVTRFGLDPDRIGLLGASAGGTLALLAGASGRGDFATDARVAAVVDLSGPSDLRAAIPTGPEYTLDFAQAELDYLGCTAFEGCLTAAAASPVTALDPSDPPVFVAHSRGEFVPIEQAEELVDALDEQGIPRTYVVLPGRAHALDMLDSELMARIVAFLNNALAI